MTTLDPTTTSLSDQAAERAMTHTALLDILMTNGKISKHVAEEVIATYRKAKVLKFNAHDGYQVVHGAYFDYDVIGRARNWQVRN